MRIGYVLTAIIAILVFVATYYYLPFQPLSNTSIIPDWATRILPNNQALLKGLSSFLWVQRGFDLIIQAILVLAMAAGLSIFFGKEAGGE